MGALSIFPIFLRIDVSYNMSKSNFKIELRSEERWHISYEDSDFDDYIYDKNELDGRDAKHEIVHIIEINLPYRSQMLADKLRTLARDLFAPEERGHFYTTSSYVDHNYHYVYPSMCYDDIPCIL